VAFGLPAWALDETVTVEYNSDDLANSTGYIVAHNEHYIILVGKHRKFLIPWTAILHIWIPKKKEAEKC